MLWWTVQTACVATLLSAAVVVVCRVGRVSPAVKHALWLLVLIKLMTPPIAWYRLPHALESRLARWIIAPQSDSDQSAEHSQRNVLVIADALEAEPVDLAPATVAEETVFVPGGPRDAGQSLADEHDYDRFVSQTDAVAAEGAAIDQPVGRRVDQPVGCGTGGLLRSRGSLVALACWLAGAIPLAIMQSLRLLRLSRLINERQSAPAPAWLNLLVRRLAARLQVRPPQVVVTSAPCSPLVCALGKPRLIWPAALGEQLSAGAREAVLLHELAHLRRRDHWVAWLELACGLIWWFNPLYWYVRHQLRENAELACDAWVVGLMPQGRRTYAQALIEVTEFVSLAPAAMPAVTMGNPARRTLERRLIMILRERTSYRVSLLGMGLIGLSMLVVLPGFSGGQDGPSQETVLESVPAAAADEAVTGPRVPVDAPLEASAANAAGADQDIIATVPITVTTARIASSAAAGEEDRIGQLETKLSQLLDEVKALRGAAPTATQPANQPAESQRTHRNPVVEYRAVPHVATRYVEVRNNRLLRSTRREDAQRGYDVETLTRAKYRLPEATAQALAGFIQEHVKNEIEARVSGETLTIIASQEDQSRIDAFIGLLREPELPAAGNPAAPGSRSRSFQEPTDDGKRVQQY